jgi:hypothetical protein
MEKFHEKEWSVMGCGGAGVLDRKRVPDDVILRKGGYVSGRGD